LVLVTAKKVQKGSFDPGRRPSGRLRDAIEMILDDDAEYGMRARLRQPLPPI
jgi:hypothetical protein